MSVSYYPLFTQTVGAAGASTITFNNIPQGYQDLKIEYSLRSNAASSTADGNNFVVNGLANIYSWTQVYSTGAGLGGNNLANSTSYLGVVPAATGTANIFSVGTLEIPNYTGGTYKQGFVNSVSENNTVGATAHLISNLIKTTSPITSLSLVCGNGSFVQYSTVTIYARAAQYSTALPVSPSNPLVVDQAGFAAVSFTPSSSDNATTYAVTDNNSVTTYGASSPIIAPVTLGSATTYTVKAINSLGSASAAINPSVTSSNSFASIATVTLASAASPIVFTNIPQNYTHLQLRTSLRNTNSGATESFSVIILNGDAGANYSTHSVFSNGASITSFNAVSATSMYGPEAPNDGRTASIFAGGIVDLLDYSNTLKYKTSKVFTGFDDNGFGYVFMHSGTWYSFAPVTAIQINSGSTFKAGSTIALYGIA